MTLLLRCCTFNVTRRDRSPRGFTKPRKGERWHDMTTSGTVSRTQNPVPEQGVRVQFPSPAPTYKRFLLALCCFAVALSFLGAPGAAGQEQPPDENPMWGLRVTYLEHVGPVGGPANLVTRSALVSTGLTRTVAQAAAAEISDKGFALSARYVPGHMVLGVAFVSPCFDDESCAPAPLQETSRKGRR